MDKKEKNAVMQEWMNFCTKNEGNPNPFKMVNDTADFFDKIWERGYKKGVEINAEIKKLN